MSRPGSWLGRGNEVVPGKPFGWAHNRERDEIRAHLIKRGWDPEGAATYFRISRIQERLRRYQPTYAERQAAARARGEPWVSPEPRPDLAFTLDELAHMAEHFAMANDPLGQEIARKAAAILSAHDKRG